MKQRKKIPLTIVLLAFILFTGACIKDHFNFSKLTETVWSPELALPLVKSHLTLRDVLKHADQNGNIQTDANNFLTLVYQGELLSLSASDLVQVPDQYFNQNASLSSSQITELTTQGSVTALFSQTLDFILPNNMQLDSLSISNALLEMDVNSTFRHSAVITMSFPDMKKNGIPFQVGIPLNYTGSTPVFVSSAVSLAGYTMDLTQAGTTYNKVPVNFTVFINNSGAGANTSDQVSINLGFRGMQYSRFFGYAGQFGLNLPVDTVEIGLFKNSLGGNVRLIDPKIKATVSNSYGMPILANITRLEGHNPNTVIFPVICTGIPSPVPVPYPNYSQAGQTLTSSFTLDSANCATVVDAIARSPHYLIYSLDALANPMGPAGRNFILDSSILKVDVEVELPLHGTAFNFLVQDTLSFSFENASEVESILLRTMVTNGFPIDIDMNIYFTDENYNIIDTIIKPDARIMPAANLNAATGKVSSPSQKTTDIVIAQPRLGDLSRVKYILLKGAATTANGGVGAIKLYSDYFFDLRIAAKVQLKVKL